MSLLLAQAWRCKTKIGLLFGIVLPLSCWGRSDIGGHLQSIECRMRSCQREVDVLELFGNAAGRNLTAKLWPLNALLLAPATMDRRNQPA
jgi:hypothetical protein